MPGFNGKGPQNEGSKTGRGLGKCKPNEQQAAPDMEKRGRGSGLGRKNRLSESGQGRGRGRGRNA